MIPPCDPSILNNNPQFKSLHNHLTTAILDPDGCDRAVEAKPERREVRDDLRACQVRYAKTQILKRVVGRVACDSSGAVGGLSDELQDLVAVIALYLHHDIVEDGDMSSASARKDNEEFLSLFRPDLDAFRANLRVVVPAVAAVLKGDVERLRVLVDIAGRGGDAAGAGVTSRFQSSRIPHHHRRQPSRPAAASISPQPVSKLLGSRMDEMRKTQAEVLPDARKQMTATAAVVLAAQAEVMERTIQVLERTKHGVLARAGKARAEHLAKVAEGMEGKVRILKHETLSSIYTPDTVSALTHYREHLQDTRIRLEEKEKEATAELQAYELADSGNDGGGDGSSAGGRTTTRERNRNMGSGPGVMVEIARRYGALVKEVEGVRMEIKRLGGEV